MGLPFNNFRRSPPPTAQMVNGISKQTNPMKIYSPSSRMIPSRNSNADCTSSMAFGCMVILYGDCVRYRFISSTIGKAFPLLLVFA